MRSTVLAPEIRLLQVVPSSTLAVTVLASTVGLAVGVAAQWPLWAIGLATIMPWLPAVTAQAVWAQRALPGLGLFYVLVVSQGAHFGEHVSQMLEIHVLGVPNLAARGIFGALDVEWVHFVWNSWVIAVVVLLLLRFRRNPWLAVTAVCAGWHAIEHLYIFVTFLGSGVPGGPGLLAAGGAIGGGLPLTRPDLHFIYNLIETVPLLIAFRCQLTEAERAIGPMLGDPAGVPPRARLQFG